MTTLTSCLLVALISLFLGWHARKLLGKPTPKELKLQTELDNTKRNLGKYKSEVNTHFEKTANLFNDLSQHYKDLYEHLKNSSKNLCDPDFSTSMLEDKTSKDWRKIGLTKENADHESRYPDHNWHPTYFEARDAKAEHINDAHNELERDARLNNLDQRNTAVDSTESTKLTETSVANQNRNTAGLKNTEATRAADCMNNKDSKFKVVMNTATTNTNSREEAVTD